MRHHFIEWKTSGWEHRTLRNRFHTASLRSRSVICVEWRAHGSEQEKARDDAGKLLNNVVARFFSFYFPEHRLSDRNCRATARQWREESEPKCCFVRVIPITIWIAHLTPQGLWQGRPFTPKGTSNMYRHKPLQKSIPKVFGIDLQLVLVPQGLWRGRRFAP